jgi:hypothetical protein
MTACAIDTAEENGNPWAARAGCVITADGSYAARLARNGDSWFPERWTLDGPEPYAVPLPGNQPEEPGTEVLPMADGRVLIHRLTDGRHAFSLLYPTGPGTGEVPLGAVECPDRGTELRLLPPAPGGSRAYALAVGRGSTAVWLVAGGAFGPEHLAQVPGRCSGGAWLGVGDRLLALDRELEGRTKTVVVDLERGGEVSPLLQITEESNDRLLLADADSGLLLIRSDAPSPGHERLGWGVLGSTLPVRFPECLHLAGCAVTPFAIQPGQVLTPESCAVALRIDSAGGSGSWLGVWRPAERLVHQLRAPEGWLAGSGLWTRDGVLHLPYATGPVPCGVSRVAAPTGAGDAGPGDPNGTTEAPGEAPREPSPTDPPEPAAPRPVPLQQAPLVGRPVANAFAGRRLAQQGATWMGRVAGETPGRLTGESESTGRVDTETLGRMPAEGTGRVNTEIPGRTTAEGTGPVNTDGTGQVSAESTGRTAAEGTARINADGTGRTATEGTAPINADGTGRVNAESTGRVAAARTGRVSAEGTGRVPATSTSHMSTEGTGRHAAASTDGISRMAAEDASRLGAENTSPTAAASASHASAESTGRTPAQSTSRHAAASTSHTDADGTHPTAAQDAGRMSADGTGRDAAASTSASVSATASAGRVDGGRTSRVGAGSTGRVAAESAGHFVSGDAGIAGLSAGEGTGRGAEESVRAASPGPAEPLRVEQVSAEAPPDLRTLRLRAENGSAASVGQGTEEAPRIAPPSAETTPAHLPFKVTTE